MNKSKFALLTIAADRFADSTYMGSRVRLRFAVEGARGLTAALMPLVGGDVDFELCDEEVTKAGLRRMFADIVAATTDFDLHLILVMAGHGDEIRGRQWFCTHDAVPGVIDLTGEELADLVKSTSARSVTGFFDFCYAGGLAAELHEALVPHLEGSEVLLLAGNAADQLAYEHPALGRGLFTLATQEAITEPRFYALAASGTAGWKATPTTIPETDLVALSVFARERTEQLAYLYAGGKRQTPEVYGTGRVRLRWSAVAMRPPTAPEPRRALAGRLRRILGWGATVTCLIGILSFFLQYHLGIGPDGWLQVRGGPAWMASLVPQTIRDRVQLPLVIGDLSAPTRGWDERRIARRARLVAGEVGGLIARAEADRENWEVELWPELSREAQRRVAFGLGRSDLASLCAAKEERRDRTRDYEFALEAALLDPERACAARYYLEQGPEIGGLYGIEDPSLYQDFGLSDLSISALRVFLRGLALAYQKLDDPDLRRRALEAAILLVSIRANKGVVRDADWLSFLRFLEDVAASPSLGATGDTSVFPRLKSCEKSWCELAAKLTTFVSAGAASAGVADGRGMMIWLTARHMDRRAAEGDGAHAWALPSLLLLARRGDLDQADFDTIIRFFRMIVPDPQQIWIDPIWLPRFARVLRMPSTWKDGLGRCVFRVPDSRVECSAFDADLAIDILVAHGHFLDAEQQARIAQRVNELTPRDRISLYGSRIRDLGCWSKLPDGWVAALGRTLDYQLRITPAQKSDPLTGVTIVEVTDLATAHAFAASMIRAEAVEPAQAMLLARYIANHWSFEGLSPLFRALGAAFDAGASRPVSAARLLASSSADALTRIAVLEALAGRRPDGLLREPVVVNGPPFTRLDAIVAIKHQIERYTFELDQLCERSGSSSSAPRRR